MDSFWTGFEKRARMGLGAKAALATAAGLQNMIGWGIPGDIKELHHAKLLGRV